MDTSADPGPSPVAALEFHIDGAVASNDLTSVITACEDLELLVRRGSCYRRGRGAGLLLLSRMRGIRVSSFFFVNGTYGALVFHGGRYARRLNSVAPLMLPRSSFGRCALLLRATQRRRHAPRATSFCT